MIPSISSVRISAGRHLPAKGLLGLVTICWLLTGCAAFKSYDPAKEDATTTPSGRTVPSIPPRSSPTPPPAVKSSRLPPEQHRTNDDCIAIIKQAEGLRLQAYQGPSGAWLIGYGHMAGVQSGMTMTRPQAEQLLHDDLREFERNVSRLVKTEVTNNEFSAMVCLSYNIGWGNFGRSTVLQKVNARQWPEAADAFLLWNKVNGKANSHLIGRRQAERTLFLKQ